MDIETILKRIEVALCWERGGQPNFQRAVEVLRGEETLYHQKFTGHPQQQRQPLAEFGEHLGIRLINALEHHLGIIYLDELREIDDDTLQSVPNLGPKSISKIRSLVTCKEKVVKDDAVSTSCD